MSSLRNILVVGNCQARPVATYLTQMCEGLIQFTPLIAHLSNTEKEATDLSLLDRADLILTQPIADSFKASHLATSHLKDRYKGSIITWPNLFFNGQTPDTISLKNQQGAVVNGPLESYQSSGVVSCWKRGMSAIQTIEYLQKELPFPEASLRATIDKSLLILLQRENEIDVAISDFIIENLESERLFFTFNHPTSRLIIELCERIFHACHISVTKPLVSEFWEEPLGRFTAPTTKPLAEWLKLRFPYTDACKGIDIIIENGNLVYGKKKIYAFSDFVQTSYKALNHQLEREEQVTFTPAYAAWDVAV